ncbi:Protein of unknown function [Gryllus bimaculatus]|nr:Protein of unknown function [Gryllus bimaculatus]
MELAKWVRWRDHQESRELVGNNVKLSTCGLRCPHELGASSAVDSDIERPRAGRAAWAVAASKGPDGGGRPTRVVKEEPVEFSGNTDEELESPESLFLEPIVNNKDSQATKCLCCDSHDDIRVLVKPLKSVINSKKFVRVSQRVPNNIQGTFFLYFMGSKTRVSTNMNSLLLDAVCLAEVVTDRFELKVAILVLTT